MNRMRQLLLLGGVATALCVGAGSALAQTDGGDPGGGPPGGGPPGGGGFGGGPGGGGFRGGGPGGGNFDPAQMQQQMMDNVRQQLEVKDDAEWTVLSAQIQKVMDARRQVGGGGMGMWACAGRAAATAARVATAAPAAAARRTAWRSRRTSQRGSNGLAGGH